MTLVPSPSTFRQFVVTAIEETGGRHDEVEAYGGEPGDPGLVGGPGSVSWEVHGDLASLAIAGSAAVIMEVLEPSVMAGVHDHSSYRTEPLQRARATLGYVLRTTFGNTPAATAVIGDVRRIHGYVSGVRPDGVAYRALDPELVAWVHSCIPWAVMTAFDRYARPLAPAEKDRYLAEQAVVGRMGGADEVPETVAELEAFVDHMRPRLAMTERTAAFVDFLAGDGGDDAESAHGLELADRRFGVHASMSLMPRWARRLTGTDHGALAQRAVFDPANRARARLVRWAYGELPCKRMALARATAADLPAGDAGTVRTRGDARAATPTAPADAQAAPADRPTAPADGPTAPADRPPVLADARAAPADGPTALADTQAAPAGKPTALADRPEVPTDGTATPVDGTATPADRLVAPADSTAAPADGPETSADGTGARAGTGDGRADDAADHQHA